MTFNDWDTILNDVENTSNRVWLYYKGVTKWHNIAEPTNMRQDCYVCILGLLPGILEQVINRTKLVKKTKKLSNLPLSNKSPNSPIHQVATWMRGWNSSWATDRWRHNSPTAYACSVLASDINCMAEDTTSSGTWLPAWKFKTMIEISYHML